MIIVYFRLQTFVNFFIIEKQVFINYSTLTLYMPLRRINQNDTWNSWIIKQKNHATLLKKTYRHYLKISL